MCIRDSHDAFKYHSFGKTNEDKNICCLYLKDHLMPHIDVCLLYTSDAADERSSVDLGGRRIIKKKNK